MTIIGVTGHRPDATGGYSDVAIAAMDQFARDILLKIHVVTPDIRLVSGMAQGFDQSMALAAIERGIAVVAAVPFASQDDTWPDRARKRYEHILSQCERIECICEGPPAKWKYQRRNQWLVDASDEVLALWSGASGGTANCVKYASSRQKKITNVWHLWVDR